MMRSVLSRLARFLVHIAQRLDRNLAGERVVVVPEHLAALRARYPGAPRHWLEAVARRGSQIEQESSGPRSPPEYDPFHSSKARDSSKGAPAVPFGRERSGAVAEFGGTNRKNSRPTFAGSASKRSRKVQLAFARRSADPGANDQPQFADGSLVRHEPLEFDPGPERTRREVRFPSPRGVRTRATDSFGDTGAQSSPPAQEIAAGRRTHVEPRFPEPPNPWPTLPSILIDEAIQQLSGLDEDALFTEQVVGTWSA